MKVCACMNRYLLVLSSIQCNLPVSKGICRYLLLCTLNFDLAVYLGCIHDDVRTEPGSWIVVGIIPIFDKRKAIRTKLNTEDSQQGAARLRISITRQ